MRDVKDVQRWLDDRCGGAGRGAGSLIRIAGWAVVALVLMGVVFPQPSPPLANNKYNSLLRKASYAKVVTLDENDPRGFRSTKAGGAYTIAWVGPSTLQNLPDRNKGFIPADVAARIGQIDGRPVHVDLYFMPGARMMDIYAGVQAALHSDADLVVVDMNPLWLFNDWAIQSYDNLNGGTFARIAGEPDQWVLAGLYPPADMVLGMAARGLPAIRDRWTYAEKIRSRIAVLDRLDREQAPPPDPHPSELQLVARMDRSVVFWNRYRPTVPLTAGPRERQLGSLRQSDVSGKAFGDLVVDRLLDALVDSGRPAYVYVPPLSPDAMAAPSISATLSGIEQHLASIANRHRSPSLEVHSQSLGRVLPPAPFVDLVHTKDDTAEVTYLADALCRHLLESGSTSDCRSRPAPEEAP